MFDSAFWAIKNKDLINAILTENPNHAIKKYLKKKRFSIFKFGIPIVIAEIALIMLPIKAFFDKIESDKAALWWIKPLFQQLIDHLKSVEDNVDILSNECKLIRNQIETDYYAFVRTELIETAYAFTSIGRKEYREIFFDKHIDDEQKQYPLIPQIDLSKYLELKLVYDFGEKYPLGSHLGIFPQKSGFRWGGVFLTTFWWGGVFCFLRNDPLLRQRK